MTDLNLITDEGLPVSLPSGAEYVVLTEQEKNYVEERARRYLEDNHFVNVSDFQDVDRMLVMELLCYRWGLWISQEKDYFGEAIDTGSLRRSLHDFSGELRQLKGRLGIDKAGRDKDKGLDSVPAYVEDLRHRAKEFGIMREDQLGKAIELFQQLRSLITVHDNTDVVEQRELHVTTDDVLEWIREVAIPEFEAIDEHFRTHKQKFWIRQQ